MWYTLVIPCSLILLLILHLQKPRDHLPVQVYKQKYSGPSLGFFPAILTLILNVLKLKLLQKRIHILDNKAILCLSKCCHKEFCCYNKCHCTELTVQLLLSVSIWWQVYNVQCIPSNTYVLSSFSWRFNTFGDNRSLDMHTMCHITGEYRGLATYPLICILCVILLVNTGGPQAVP